MDVTALPFNRLLGLEPAAPGSGFLVTLPAGPQFTNHLGTVHAAALLAVAEAGSGAFLAREFGGAEGLVAVVRRLEAKFRRPAQGRVAARASVPAGETGRWAAVLASHGRVLAAVPVEVLDAEGAVVLAAVVEWFIARAGEGSTRADQEPAKPAP